jgi:flagellar biosynthesis/type III secretory pathway protein FliH
MTKGGDIRPFLASVATPTRPLGAALPALATPPVTSPWLPRPAEPAPAAAAAAAPAGPSPAELAAIYDEARDKGLDDGRAEGVAETAALRARLGKTLDELEAARISLVAPSAEVIAEIATCAVGAWIGNIYPGLLFAPIVRAWLAHAADQPATVRVHPDDAAALAEAIGEAPLTIATDASLARGALAVASATSELVHDFADRLADLRTAIVTALTGVDE